MIICEVVSLLLALCQAMADLNLKKKHELTVRTSQLNKDYDECIGKALAELPVSTLPTHRNILQRYRYLRTEDPEGEYKLYILINVLQLTNI